MPELRKDPIVGRWVIISTERGRRPSEFIVQYPPTKEGFCPFCPGNEDKTPHEVLAYREGGNGHPNSSNWSVRVVPNKYPALRVEGELEREGDGIFDRMNGIGAHEIIIESTDHNDTLSTIHDDHFAEILHAYRDRIMDLKKDFRFRYILIFKNYGEAAGASLEHSHSQLIALPIIPKRVQEELDGSREYFNLKERCIYCDIIRQEIMEEKRVVAENHDFIAVTPYAPKAPFEVWLLPKKHEASFEDMPRQKYNNLARLFSHVLKSMNKMLSTPPYNFVLHTSPLDGGDHQHYHWHFEIMPTIVRVAGFEMGTGFYINPTPPEEAARFLREAKV
jgi:UDPglucose--hexose-1-phosphate uridylyltransferase